MKSTCPYCGASLVMDAGGHYYCSFCQMAIAQNDVQQDGKRKPLSISPFVSLDYADLPTPELMKKSTLALVLLLREVRKERSSKYNHLRILHKVADSGVEDIQSVTIESGKSYEWWTRKAWVIENILRDRMDHFPTRITDQYLNGLTANIQTSRGDMHIRTERTAKNTAIHGEA